VTEEEHFAGGAAGAEAELEDVSIVALTVAFDAAIKGFGVSGGQVHAGVDGGFVVGGGFGADEMGDEIEELGVLAACSGEEGAHGDRG
jgi:hypothetical protein